MYRHAAVHRFDTESVRPEPRAAGGGSRTRYNAQCSFFHSLRLTKGLWKRRTKMCSRVSCGLLARPRKIGGCSTTESHRNATPSTLSRPTLSSRRSSPTTCCLHNVKLNIELCVGHAINSTRAGRSTRQSRLVRRLRPLKVKRLSWPAQTTGFSSASRWVGEEEVLLAPTGSCRPIVLRRTGLASVAGS